MIERLVRKHQRETALRVSLLSGIASGIVSLLSTGALTNFVSALLNMGIGFFIGFMAPLIIQFLADTIRTNPIARRMPGVVSFVLFVLFTTAVVTALTLGVMVGLSFVIEARLPDATALRYSIRTALTVAGSLAVLLNVYLTLQQYLGRAFFRDLFLGRYSSPREELKAVAFVDLVGSTGLAESMGPGRFFDLLNDYLGTVEMIAHYCGGTIYKYLGDGVIIVWGMPAAAHRPLECLVMLRDEMIERGDHFERRFGVRPRFTAGLHLGPLLVGEIGRERKELGYWGDTMNTAQRVQDACKRAGSPILVSEEYLAAVRTLPAPLSGLSLHRIEGVTLKGKTTHMVLHAVR